MSTRASESDDQPPGHTPIAAIGAAQAASSPGSASGLTTGPACDSRSRMSSGRTATVMVDLTLWGAGALPPLPLHHHSRLHLAGTHLPRLSAGHHRHHVHPQV